MALLPRILVCPIDRYPLVSGADGLQCQKCRTIFPIVRGIPVLLNEANSVFRVADFTEKSGFAGASAYASGDRTTGLRRLYRRFAYAILEAGAGLKTFDVGHALDRIQQEDPAAQILVIGAGESRYSGNVTYTDVAFAQHTDCICDAHDLPFPNAFFDAVLACSILEHVVDPYRCVSEIERVLRPAGYVYAVTPFLQPVHMGAYDFTRFTPLGHRRLFRHFDDIRSGMGSGPGTSTAFVLRYLLLSLSDRQRVQSIMRLIGLITCYPLRLLDHYFLRRESSFDAASAVFFFGTKREMPIADRDILKLYRGAK